MIEYLHNKHDAGYGKYRDDGIGIMIFRTGKKYYKASTIKIGVTDDFTKYKKDVKSVNKKSSFVVDII